jgi:hypothetical protein
MRGHDSSLAVIARACAFLLRRFSRRFAASLALRSSAGLGFGGECGFSIGFAAYRRTGAFGKTGEG